MPEQRDSESEVSEQLQYTYKDECIIKRKNKKHTLARCPEIHRYKTGKEKHSIQDNFKILQG